jgi:hypothetical protein
MLEYERLGRPRGTRVAHIASSTAGQPLTKPAASSESGPGVLGCEILDADCWIIGLSAPSFRE